MNAWIGSLTVSYGANCVSLDSVKKTVMYMFLKDFEQDYVLILDDTCLHLPEEYFSEVVRLWRLSTYLEKRNC